MTEPAENGPIGDLAANVRRLQARAAELPSPDEVRELAEQAIQHGSSDGMSLDQIRQLAAMAVTQADEVASLLRRLNTLLAGGDGR